MRVTITLEQLKAWNPVWHPRDEDGHELDERDVSIVQSAVNFFVARQKDYHGMGHPAPGDYVVMKTGKDDISPNGMYCEDDGGRLQHICRYPYRGMACMNEDGTLSVSGGPFERADGKMTPVLGQCMRTFWIFGHCGSCAHGGVHFHVPVMLWMHESVGNIRMEL